MIHVTFTSEAAMAEAEITECQVRITKIRAGRKTPGLAAQHLESFKLARILAFFLEHGQKKQKRMEENVRAGHRGA